MIELIVRIIEILLYLCAKPYRGSTIIKFYKLKNYKYVLDTGTCIQT